METFLFIDTETTGFIKSGRLIQDGQARVCQIAMLLTDDSGRSLMEFSSLIKPDGWTIGEGAREVHGFTDEQCAAYGLEAIACVKLFNRLHTLASKTVAHNENFDRGMMDIERAYVSRNEDIRLPVWFCTMKTNTHLKNGKWPKLDEALTALCGRSLGDTAHDAMYDVKACRDIFFAMRGIRIAA